MKSSSARLVHERGAPVTKNGEFLNWNGRRTFSIYECRVFLVEGSLLSDRDQRISKIELPTIFPLDWPCFPTRLGLVSHSTWVCVFFANNAPSTGHVRQCVSEHRWLQHGAFHEVLWINR